uniref:Uncharacterized protein n=1 Tax=Desertifilum tharense IPPAS B-1220 TaxID=1781255 RepID=A0ACD5GRG7_9CYAN
MGDGQKIYYDDGNTTAFGVAVITDFNPAQDKIQLTRVNFAANISDGYILSVQSIENLPSTLLFVDNDGIKGLSSADELIAIVQGVTNLHLGASYFTFI